jgi:phosphatidylglycerophosphatase A
VERFLKKALAKIIVTVFGIGCLPWMPGTWGSLVAIPLGVYLVSKGPVAFFVGFFLLTLGGWFFTKLYLEQNPHKEDPSEGVIDEVAGQLLTLAPLLWMPLAAHWIIPAAFIGFRLFDIFKPWPVSWADNLKGSPSFSAFGIMLDDVVAAGYCLLLMMLVSHFIK